MNWIRRVAIRLFQSHGAFRGECFKEAVYIGGEDSRVGPRYETHETGCYPTQNFHGRYVERIDLRPCGVDMNDLCAALGDSIGTGHTRRGRIQW